MEKHLIWKFMRGGAIVELGDTDTVLPTIGEIATFDGHEYRVQKVTRKIEKITVHSQPRAKTVWEIDAVG